MCRVGMGRVGYVPSWLCAEFAMCRVDPAPLIIMYVLIDCVMEFCMSVVFIKTIHRTRR